MTAIGILNDFDSTSSAPGLIVTSSGISPAEAESRERNIIKHGFLWKRHVGVATSRMSSRAKFFVLTRATLDYYRNDRRDKLKGSYQLAAITSVTCLNENASTMKISFLLGDPLFLQAGDKSSCHEWIHALEEGIHKWSMKDTNISTELRPENENSVSFPSQTVPRRMELEEHIAGLSGEFAMIKYSRAGKASIPHERVFQLDMNRLQMMWRKASKSYCYKSTLEISKIIEVRCGQQTKNFNQFPYLEVDKQSFSLMFEREQGEWSSLMSLDIICDSMLAAQSWKRGLKALIYGTENHAPLRSQQDAKDPITLYLQRVWATMEHKGQISYEEALSFVHNLTSNISRRNLRNFIRNISRTQHGATKSSSFLNWDCFLFLFNSLANQPEVHEIYKKYLKTFPELGLTPQEFLEFLEKEQKETNVTINTCVDLIEFHDRPHSLYKRICARGDPSAFQNSRRHLSYHGFLSFLRSKDNSVFDFNHMKVYQDMNRPLSDYFINSSHNTYLTGHQLKGLSSCEAYVRVLQQGSRCLEIDCWDGPDEPIVTHGRTLTSKIKFRDVIKIIKEYAFETNPYPVILSLENHCSEEQQVMMANMFVAEFDDLLATEDLSENNCLPSPESLLRKIILKGRPISKKKSKTLKTGSRHTSVRSPSHARSWSQISELSQISATSRSPLKATLSSDSITGNAAEDDVSLNTEELVQVPLAGSMGRLIVYCRAVPYKRNEINENCCEMHSFSETHAMDLIEKLPKDIIYISRKKLLRIYPKGSRVESSNYNPMPMWKVGIQMASLNFQKPDAGMHVNQGFFRSNGGCGYVLKPQALRRNLATDFSKLIDEKNSSTILIVHLKILSGQFVDTDIIGKSPLSLDVELVGSDSKYDIFSTEVVSDYCSPQWKGAEHTFLIKRPELSLFYFKLVSVNRTSKMVLQTVIPVASLKQGLRYIPLQTLTGVNVSQNGVFVNISIDNSIENRDAVKSSYKEASFKPRRRITTF